MDEIVSNSKFDLGDDYQISDVKFGLADALKMLGEIIVNNDAFKSITSHICINTKYGCRGEFPPLAVATSFLIVAFTSVWFISYMILRNKNLDETEDGSCDSKNVAQEEIIVHQRDFTIQQLRDFDGQNSDAIYIALKREVFDVSAAYDMYGKESGCVFLFVCYSSAKFLVLFLRHYFDFRTHEITAS